MKKEKKIKAHTRRTKSGKTITVKAHTAKYDAAEELKKAAKKKGAGEELEERKKKSLVKDAEDVAWDILDAYTEKDVREVATALGISPKQAVSWLEGPNYPNFSEKDYYKAESAAKKFLGSSIYTRLDPYGADTPMAVIAKIREVKVPKSSKGETPSLKSKPTKKSSNSYEQCGFTKEEFAEWYEGTGSKADKKVEKALRKAMGSKAYNDLSDSAADNYKAGGADNFFKKGIKKMQATTNSSKNGTSKATKKSTGVIENTPKTKTARKESDNWRKTADIPLRKKGDDAIGSVNVGKRTIDVEVSPVSKGYVVSMYDRKNNIGWIADTRITTLSDLSKHIKNRISPKYRRVSRLLESGEIDYDVERIVPKKLKEQEI